MGQEPTLSGRAQFRAGWWTDALTVAWNEARVRLLRGWPLATADRPLTPEHAEEAMALGFGARRTHTAYASWDDNLLAILKREWQSNGPVDCPWMRAAASVQHGWENGRAR